MEDTLVTDGTGSLFSSASALRITPKYVCGIETTDQTNVVQLRFRKAPLSVNISNLLEKVARGGEYDAPIEKLLARQSTCRRNLTIPTCMNQHADLSILSTEIKRQPDFQAHRKIQKLFKQKRRREESTPLRPTESNPKRTEREVSLHSLRIDILHPSGIHGIKKLRNLVWGGIPSSIRGEVWSSLVGNALNIDRTLYEHCVQMSHRYLQHSQRDRMVKEQMLNELQDFFTHFNLPVDENLQENCAMCSLILANINSTPMRQELCMLFPSQTANVTRKTGALVEMEDSPQNDKDRSVCLQFVKQDMNCTFRALRLFQLGCPFHTQLHDLLAAYVIYQPQIGYIPGMSYMAAVLLLVMPDPFDAFVLFANLLDKPCHRAFYNPDESEFVVYFRAFSQLLSDRLPRLHAHFMQVGLEPNMYLFDWLFNIFSRVLPLEAALRVWDLYCAEGELILFRVAAALLTHYETHLLQYGFDQLVTFLTTPMPPDLTGDQLVKQVHSFRLKRKIWTRYLKRSHSDIESRSAARTWSNIVSTSAANPILHKLGSKLPIARQQSVEPVLETQHRKCTKSVNRDTTEHEFPHDIRPGPVDHSAVTLLSLTPSSSLLGAEEDMDLTDLMCTIPAVISSTMGHADELDALDNVPWSAGISPSPFLLTTFGFDEVPTSAPPDSQRMLMKHHKLLRCASEWTLSHRNVSSSLYRTGRQAASIHDMGSLTGGRSLRHQLTPGLPRSLSTVFFPSSWKEEQQLDHQKTKPRLTCFRPARPELIP